jgi:aryl-alcohol dehydrogenase-like predicted oxidoreductase
MRYVEVNGARLSVIGQTLRTVAKNHDATPSQVALAWIVHHPNVVAIPGASSLTQLESNVAAADLQLSDDEITELTAASDAFHPVRGFAAAPKVIKRRIRR